MSAHGRHVKLVGYGDPARLGSVDGVRAFLVALVASVGMRPLGALVLHDVAIDLAKMNVEPFEDEGGVTGIVVLSTSHCAIHTWPARAYMVLDLFSCRTFDSTEVERIVADAFGMTSMRCSDVSAALAPPEPTSAPA